MSHKDKLYFLRQVYRYVHEIYLIIRHFTELALYLVFPFGGKILIPGTPEHENLGDSAIVIAQKAFLEKCGVPANRIKEVTFSEYKRYHKLLHRLLMHTNVIITQLGGGNMGDQWLEEERLHRQLLVDFPKNPEIIFPQTIFYTVTKKGKEEQKKSIEYYNGRKNLILFARERKSYELMKSLYPDSAVFVAPDIVLSAFQETFGVRTQKRETILLCMRNDVEKSLTSEEHTIIENYLQNNGYSFRVTDMYSDCPVTKENREECVRQKMEEFASAKLVITDRLHGMIFSAITGTPCIVFGNYNHKVEGTYEWIKYLEYIRFVRSVDEMKSAFTLLINMTNCQYDNMPLVAAFVDLNKNIRQFWQKD